MLNLKKITIYKAILSNTLEKHNSVMRGRIGQIY